MSDELQTYIEPELEARIVALVLGEASAFEAEELARLISERPELKACKERLEKIHGVLVAAHREEKEKEWKLSEERRKKILAKGEMARQERVWRNELKKARQRRRNRRQKLVVLCAACVVMGLLLMVTTPLVLRSQKSAGFNMTQEELVELATRFEDDGNPRFEARELNSRGMSEARFKSLAREDLTRLSVGEEQLETKFREMEKKSAGGEGLKKEMAQLEIPQRQAGSVGDLTGGRQGSIVDLPSQERRYSYRRSAQAEARKGQSLDRSLDREASAASTLSLRGEESTPDEQSGTRPNRLFDDENEVERKDQLAAALAEVDESAAAVTGPVVRRNASLVSGKEIVANGVLPKPAAAPAPATPGQAGEGGVKKLEKLQRGSTVAEAKAMPQPGLEVGEINSVGRAVVGPPTRSKGMTESRVARNPRTAPAERSDKVSSESDFLGGGTVGGESDQNNRDFINPVDRVEIPGIPNPPGTTTLVTGIDGKGQKAMSQQTSDGFDLSRGQMLYERDKAWAGALPPIDQDSDGIAPANEIENLEAAVTSAKLKQTIIPEINLKNASLEEAIELVEQRTRELDNTSLDDGRRGVEIEVVIPKIVEDDGLDLGDAIDGKENVIPELRLKNVPAETALQYLAEISKTRYQIDDNGRVTFKPVGVDDTADLIQKQWKVAPGFLDFLSSAKPSAEVPDDPFVVDERSSELPPAQTIKDLLKEHGIDFPPNTSASYLSDSGHLIVRTTPTQLEAVEALVSAHQKKKAEDEAERTRRLERENFETSTAVKSDSTFSLNVSDVSFKLAKAALAEGKRPEIAKVRAEEFVNALDYGDDRPTQAEKISCEIEQGTHPFLSQRNLMRISMSTASLGRNAGTPLRLTLLLDQSGSMERADRVVSLQRAFALLAAQLNGNDEVTLIGFARTPRLLAERVKGNEVAKLAEIIANPVTEGGTNLEEALLSGLQLAQQQFLPGAQNRIILLTDGAANLGDAKPETLARQVESMRKAGIAFDACGVGADGLNDEVLSSLAKQGDGRYYFLDRPEDADEGFARQIAGALRPAAKNVKVQVLFNPERVTSFKLYGFEQHQLKKEDFRNDAVDAAEMAAEESGVALYHFEPNPEGRGDVGTVSVRFLDPASNEMVERTWLIPYEPQVAFFNEADPKLRLAGVAGLFAERLKGSPVGERVELKRLRQELPDLKARFGNQSRVHELETMLRQAGE